MFDFKKILVIGFFSFFLEIYIPALITMSKYPKRNLWWLWMPLFLGIGASFYFTPTLSVGPFNFLYLLITLFVIGASVAIYKAKPMTYIANGFAAFGIQHLLWEVMLILYAICLKEDSPTWQGFLIYGLVFGCGYLGLFLLYFFRERKHSEKESAPWALSFSTVGLMVITWVLSSLISEETFSIPVGFLDIIACLFALTVHFLLPRWEDTIRKESQLEADNATLENLYQQEVKMSQVSKETIDIINMRCHDLKNQIAALENMDEEDKKANLDKLKEDVNIYGRMAKTGNKTLDTVLTEKGLLCESKHIQLDYLVDPDSLSFLEEVDIATLFGNALDNAIEAEEKEKEEERIIRLNVEKKKGFTRIHIENTCTRKVPFSDSLPLTTKADKSAHGFGTKSIRYIVHKYQGNVVMNQENNLFIINILLPNPESK